MWTSRSGPTSYTYIADIVSVGYIIGNQGVHLMLLCPDIIVCWLGNHAMCVSVFCPDLLANNYITRSHPDFLANRQLAGFFLGGGVGGEGGIRPPWAFQFLYRKKLLYSNRSKFSFPSITYTLYNVICMHKTVYPPHRRPSLFCPPLAIFLKPWLV